MPFEYIVMISLFLTPVFIGLLGGALSWHSYSTYMPSSWRVAEQSVFDEESRGQDLSSLAVLDELPEIESYSPTIKHENSVPNPEMEIGISELLAAVNEDAERDHSSSHMEGLNEVDIPDSYPVCIPAKEYKDLETKYGSHIVSIITTTPAIGATGTTDVMIGRLVKNVVGFVLQYGEYHALLKGNFPIEHEGKVLLVMGQFQSPEEFYVYQSIDPKEYESLNLPNIDQHVHLVEAN